MGRRAELHALTSALDRAAVGGGCAVVALSGTAGMGKSRLANECAVLARDRGFSVLAGAAGLYQQDLSFAPMVEALRPLVREESARRASLVEGLPDLRRLFDDLPLPSPTPVGDSGVERTRLFEAVCRLLERLSIRQPVLLVVDDLQWADASSLALVQYLVRGLGRCRFVALLVYRADEVGPQLRVVLSSLRRLGSLVEVGVGPLDSEETAAIASHLLDGQPPVGLVEVIGARAQGVPLFVTALVSSLLESGSLMRRGGRWVLGPVPQAVPPGVSDIFLSKLDGVDPTARTVLEVVSVCGDAARTDILRAILGPDDGLPACLERLCAAGLLVEDLIGGRLAYRMCHPLLAEIVYDRMSLLARNRLHARAEVALGRVEPSDWIRRAHHVRRAGGEVVPEHALEILSAATETALAQRAGVEAVSFARSAIGLAGRLDQTGIVPDLLGKLAVAAEYAGEMDTAIAARRDVAAAASDMAVMADQLRLLALVEWDAGRFNDALAHADQAKAALTGLRVGPLHVAVFVTRLTLNGRRAAFDAMTADIAHLQRLAATSTDPTLDALISTMEIDLNLHEGRYKSAQEQARKAADYVRTLGDGMHPRVYGPWGVVALACGFHGEAASHAAEVLASAHSAGMPVLEVMPRVLQGYALVYAGDWDAAAAAADAALSVAHRVGMNRGIAAALLQHALIHVNRGELSQAEACVAEADAVFGHGTRLDRHVFVIADTVEALLAGRRGDWAAALACAQRAERGTSYLPGMPLRVLGDAQLGVGDLEAARRTADKLAGLGPGAPLPQAAELRLRGLVTANTDAYAATTLLSRAAAAFEALQMPYETAVTWLDWADVLAAGDPAGAAGAAERSLEVLDRLGARPDADRARRLLRALGRRPAPVPRARKPGSLSGREAEVARLVAEGLSNADVAARLFISPRTVTTHLQNIYRRLGVDSRAGLTRFVLERLSRDEGRST